MDNDARGLIANSWLSVFYLENTKNTNISNTYIVHCIQQHTKVAQAKILRITTTGSRNKELKMIWKSMNPYKNHHHNFLQKWNNQ